QSQMALAQLPRRREMRPTVQPGHRKGRRQKTHCAMIMPGTRRDVPEVLGHLRCLLRRCVLAVEREFVGFPDRPDLAPDLPVLDRTVGRQDDQKLLVAPDRAGRSEEWDG